MLTRVVLLAALVGVCFGAGTLLWTAGTENSVYDDVVMTHENTASTTDYMASPYVMATYVANGRGTPIWEWIGQHQMGVTEEFYATGLRAPTRPVIVDLIGLVYGERNNTIVIHGFQAHMSTPVWEYFVPNAQNAFDGAHLLDVAEDGSFMALLYFDIHDHTTKCLVLDAQSGRLHTVYSTDVAKTHRPRRLDMDMTGHVVTFVDYNTVYQLSTDTRALRGDILELPASFISHEISTNQEGDFLAVAHDQVIVYEFDPRARKWNQRWASEKSTWGLADALHLGRRGLLFVGWARLDGKQQMFERYEIYNGSKPVWVYTTKVEAGNVRNYIDDVETDLFGEFIAVATWGDLDKTNPQFLVFDSWSPNPVFTYYTPGSMHAVDICHEADRTVLISVAGKHAHETDRQHWGGDVFMFRVTVN